MQALQLLLVLSLIIFPALTVPQQSSPDSSFQSTSSHELSIRLIRAQSNAAIVNRDINALENTWLDELHVAGSNGSAVTSGAMMGSIFLRLFEHPEFVRFERNPTTIDLSPGQSLAAETGVWYGYWKKTDGTMRVSGPYMAQWKSVKNEWKIASEVYVATQCGGSSQCNESR